MRSLLPFTLVLATSSLAAAPQECLGRLTFKMPAHFQWATGQASIPMGSNASFSDLMAMPADNWDYNRNIKIIVSQPTAKYYFADQWRAFMPGTEALKMQRDLVETRKGIIEDRKKSQQRNNELRAQGKKIPDGWEITKEGEKRAQELLKKAEADLYAMENHSVPWVKLAIPDARTVNYDAQRAFVWRNERVYMFYLSNRGYPEYSLNNAPITVTDVNTLLSTFKPRALGEVPTQTGFCFPYGFIGDNGTPVYEIKNSFRFTDQPTVAYSLYTGDINLFTRPSIAKQGILNSDPPRMAEPDKFTVTTVSKTISLNNGLSLQLTGWNISEKNPIDVKKSRHYYWVYGKIDGSLTQNNKPYIGVQIKAFDKNEKDGRANYAPPLETAIKRLEPLLNSIQIGLK